MGIVKVSEEMHSALRDASDALSRSVNGQAEHWLRVGMLAELNPHLSYGEICKLLLKGRLPQDAIGIDTTQPVLAKVS
ncbi:ParD-like family protein [Pseudomonadota bacterium AL_CKDN230030165-1A_HGKHYDSX7]